MTKRKAEPAPEPRVRREPYALENRKAVDFMRSLKNGENWTEKLARLLADHADEAVEAYKGVTNGR